MIKFRCDVKVLLVAVPKDDIALAFWAICDLCNANSATEAASIPPTVPVNVGASTGAIVPPNVKVCKLPSG